MPRSALRRLALHRLRGCLDSYDIVLRRTDTQGKPFRDLAALAAAEPFVLALNAGM